MPRTMPHSRSRGNPTAEGNTKRRSPKVSSERYRRATIPIKGRIAVASGVTVRFSGRVTSTGWIFGNGFRPVARLTICKRFLKSTKPLCTGVSDDLERRVILSSCCNVIQIKSRVGETWGGIVRKLCIWVRELAKMAGGQRLHPVVMNAQSATRWFAFTSTGRAANTRSGTRVRFTRVRAFACITWRKSNVPGPARTKCLIRARQNPFGSNCPSIQVER
jgi:hypothetical protein